MTSSNKQTAGQRYADECDAWARHAHAVNGFGDAAVPVAQASRRTSMTVPPSDLQPHVDSVRYAECAEAY